MENVIANAFKGKSVLSLSGMKNEGTMDGVTVLRPLIGLTKKDVYEYAEKYGVGFFKDTTPSWSTRGRVRNEVRQEKTFFCDMILQNIILIASLITAIACAR